MFWKIVWPLVLVPYYLSAQIYDCFLFFKELEVLEIRLNEMSPYVDKFVLVESIETFRGNPKPLIFQENAHKFAKFQDKIIHVVVRDLFPGDNPWLREHFQRNQIMRGLVNCKNDDIILISDCDEIVKGIKIPRMIDETKKFQYICGFQRQYCFFLNRDTLYVWPGTVATTYGYLKQYSPQHLRDIRSAYCLLEDIGWHFTYMGGLNRTNDKLQSFSHSYSQVYEMANLLTEDEFRRLANLNKWVIIDETFPEYVQQNQSYFIKLGLIDLDQTYTPH